MGRRWGNSILEINSKGVACHYCGNLIKNKAWFKIKLMNGHQFPFCSRFCEGIWDKKNGYVRGKR